MGKGGTIYIGDLEPDAGVRPAFDENDERAVTAAVKLGSAQEVRDVARQLTDKLRASGQSMAQCNLFFLELLTCLLKLTRSAGLELSEVLAPVHWNRPEPRILTRLRLWRTGVERCLRIQELIRRRRTDSAGGAGGAGQAVHQRPLRRK